MVDLGYFASLEEFSPAECLEQIQWAEQAGFESIWVNDHFHPWFDHFEDGEPAHGGNCWTWMPAALDRTNSIKIGTGVTAILNRYHPGNVAHRLATMMELYPGRVFLGVGTGEGLNESPLGFEWPTYGERARRTAEAIDIIKSLFQGRHVSYEGDFWSLNNAHLYTGPNEAPPIHIAGSGSTTARMAGDLADGFMTIYQDTSDVKQKLFPAVKKGIKRSDDVEKTFDSMEKTVLIHCSYGETIDSAVEPCKPWRLTLLPVFFEHGIADPRYLQMHGEKVGIEQLKEEFLISTEPQDFVDVIDSYVQCGFDRILLQSSSPNQESLCQMVSDEIMPSF